MTPYATAHLHASKELVVERMYWGIIPDTRVIDEMSPALASRSFGREVFHYWLQASLRLIAYCVPTR